MTEAPSNQSPLNRQALAWLRQAKASPQSEVSYLAQLAEWGLESGRVEIPRPLSASQPERHNLEDAVSSLLRPGREEAAFASQWFLSNPNLPPEEQGVILLRQLSQATTAEEAAQAVVETAYDVMVASSGLR